MNKRLITIIVFCLVGLFYCKVQSHSSVEEQYTNVKCMDTVVARINPLDNNSTVISYNDAMSSLPTFVYHTHAGSVVSKRFTWPMISNTFGYIFYTVNDMIIVGGDCYFCGGKRAIIGWEYSMEGYAMPVYQNTGFFGWFDVSQMSATSPTSLDLYLFDLPVSGELKRMDGIFVSGGVGLGLISEQTLAIVRGYGNSWACHVQNVGTDERLEDVKITENHLVTLSRFLSDDYSFGLRCETKNDAFDSPATHLLYNYYNGIRYQTYPMTTVSIPNSHPTMRQRDEVMRMVNHPSSDLVTVAYNGEYLDSGDCQHSGFHTAMYLMNLSNCVSGHVNILMDDAQLLTTGLLKKAQYSLWEMRYVSAANTIAMLQGAKTEYTGMWSILQDASWSPTWMPRSVQADYRALKSMDVDAAGWAYLAGRSIPDKKLLHFRQDLGKMERSCYSTRPVTVVEKLILNSGEVPVPIGPSLVPIFTITQSHFQSDATTTGYYPKCNTSY